MFHARVSSNAGWTELAPHADRGELAKQVADHIRLLIRRKRTNIKIEISEA